MKAKSMKICLGISTGLAVVGLGSFFIMQNQAAERSVYINQTLESGIESAVSDTVAPSKGVLELDGDGDSVADIYMDMGSFKNALELASEQIDANTSNIAVSNDVYDNTETYSIGDLCIYNGMIYQCKTTINTAENWTEEHWESVSLTSEMNALNDSFNTVNNNLTADGLQFQFATDGEGNYGYLGADDSFIPFKCGFSSATLLGTGTYKGVDDGVERTATKTVNSGEYTSLLVCYNGVRNNGYSSFTPSYSGGKKVVSINDINSYSSLYGRCIIQLFTISKNTDFTATLKAYKSGSSDFSSLRVSIYGIK